VDYQGHVELINDGLIYLKFIKTMINLEWSTMTSQQQKKLDDTIPQK
jgi:hypothetical protein